MLQLNWWQRDGPTTTKPPSPRKIQTRDRNECEGEGEGRGRKIDAMMLQVTVGRSGGWAQKLDGLGVHPSPPAALIKVRANLQLTGAGYPKCESEVHALVSFPVSVPIPSLSTVRSELLGLC